MSENKNRRSRVEITNEVKRKKMEIKERQDIKCGKKMREKKKEMCKMGTEKNEIGRKNRGEKTKK